MYTKKFAITLLLFANCFAAEDARVIAECRSSQAASLVNEYDVVPAQQFEAAPIADSDDEEEYPQQCRCEEKFISLCKSLIIGIKYYANNNYIAAIKFFKKVYNQDKFPKMRLYAAYYLRAIKMKVL